MNVWWVACTIGRMKRAGVVAGVVLLLALAGCSAPAADAPAESAAPLVAESPAVSTAGVDEAAFLEDVRENLPANTQIPDATDEQLLAAGADACEQRAAGVSSEEVRVVEGEQPNVAGSYVDSNAISGAAARHLGCSD